MKQIFTAAILGIFLLTVAAAADLGLSVSSIDYGTVKEGPLIIKTVILTNNGSETLTITNAAAS